ncbi:DNA internalization-related competence protein ComEC/Rec2 [Ornithinimicrobium sp. Arc0846-15]|nr:DNA internalization-related competence protein ComEC/Rec2 [Ornithinimicrobium laminariae]
MKTDMTAANTSPARTGSPLDFRLLVPSLIAWATTCGLIYTGYCVQLAIAWLCLGSGLLVWVVGWLRANRRATRDGEPAAQTAWSGFLTVTLLICALALFAAGVDARARQMGPIVDLAEQRAVVTVQASVATQPRLIPSTTNQPDLLVLTLDIAQVTAPNQTSTQTASVPVLVFVATGEGWDSVQWRSGVEVSGRLSPLRERSADVSAQFAPLDEPFVDSARGPVLALSDIARERLRESVGPLPSDAAGLIPGLVIGDTSLTPGDLSAAMKVTGMSHLSAVSGSNVAIVLGAVVLLCRWTGLTRRWRPWCAVIALLGFVILCRPEPSVLRASAMGLVGLVGLSTARRGSSLSALSVAMLVLLCWDPGLARSYGFALSVLATLGIVIFARPWADVISARLPRIPSWFGEAVSIPLAAQVTCAPVIVLLQGSVSTVAVFANLLAAPLVAPTTILGIVATIAGLVWPPLGAIGAWLGAPSAWLIGRVARGCAALPGGTMNWLDGVPGALLLAAVSTAVVLTFPWVWSHLSKSWLPGCLALVVLVVALWPTELDRHWPPDNWLVVGCDVGQGDAFVVTSGDGSAVLIDTGPSPELLAECLGDLGVQRLDAVVLSHFHADHISGLSAVLAEYEVGQIYLPPGTSDTASQEEWTLTQARNAGVTTARGLAGDTWQWGDVVAQAWWPTGQAAQHLQANDASLVVSIEAQGKDMLFLGDVEGPGARALLAPLAGQQFDVVKVAHHGSADQNEQLIESINPAVAMIGVGADNTFGHPNPIALDLFTDHGARILRTDTDGNFAVLLTEGQLATQTQNGTVSP